TAEAATMNALENRTRSHESCMDKPPVRMEPTVTEEKKHCFQQETTPSNHPLMITDSSRSWYRPVTFVGSCRDLTACGI
ncbi:MAG: hypothetical protein ACK58T_06720, partial [Phycisphaerae bacterium]